MQCYVLQTMQMLFERQKTFEKPKKYRIQLTQTYQVKYLLEVKVNVQCKPLKCAWTTQLIQYFLYSTCLVLFLTFCNDICFLSSHNLCKRVLEKQMACTTCSNDLVTTFQGKMERHFDHQLRACTRTFAIKRNS